MEEIYYNRKKGIMKFWKNRLALLLIPLMIFGCAKGPNLEEAIREITEWLSDYFEVQRVEITATCFEKEVTKVRARASVELTYPMAEGFISSLIFGIEGETGDTVTTKELAFSFKKYDTGWKIEEGPVSKEDKSAISVERSLGGLAEAFIGSTERSRIVAAEIEVTKMRQAVGLFEIDYATYNLDKAHGDTYTTTDCFGGFVAKLKQPNGVSYMDLPNTRNFTNFNYNGDDSTYTITVQAKDTRQTTVTGIPNKTYH